MQIYQLINKTKWNTTYTNYKQFYDPILVITVDFYLGKLVQKIFPFY